MKVFVAKVLVEGVDLNSCSVEVFDSFEKAREYAESEIHLYAEDYEGEVVEDYSHRVLMQSGDTYVEIEIVETEIK